MTSQKVVKHDETSGVIVAPHDNASIKFIIFFRKFYITPFKMPNYPFVGNYSQVKNH